jgi:hypothetical protein
MTSTAKDLAGEIILRKQQARKLLTALPIEEKVRRLVEMQRRANEVRRATGRKELFVWNI